MSQILHILDRIVKVIGKTVSYLMLLVVGIVCYEVFMRYVFHRPTVWASEAIVICCSFLYVLGAAWALQENRHVKIDILWEKLNPRNRSIIDSITFLFFCLLHGNDVLGRQQVCSGFHQTQGNNRKPVGPSGLSR